MRIFLTTISLLISLVLNAQQGTQYPDYLRAWKSAEGLINPSSIPDSVKYAVNFHSKFRSGPLKNIGFNYAEATIALATTNKQRHLFRASIFNETEGPYIKRPRFYLNYAYLLPFSQKIKASLGVRYGYINTIFNTPSVYNGSAGVFNGGLGGTLYIGTVQLGAAALQLFDNVIVTKSKAIVGLGRYYVFTVRQVLAINPFWQIEPSVLWRLLPTTNDDLVISGEAIYRKAFSGGFVWTVTKGTGIFIKALRLSNKFPLSFTFLYQSTLLSALPASFNHVEVGVSIFH